MTKPIPVRNWTALCGGAEPAPDAIIRQWRRLLNLGSASLYKPGSRLLDQSSSARTVYLIESGIVKLSRVSASSSREVVLLLRFPGELVGTYGGLLRLPHFVSATTVTHCQMVVTPAETALDAFRANAEAACFLAQCQTIDAVRIQSLLMEARLLSAERRFFRLLLQIATAIGSVRSSTSCVSVRVPLSESEIADLIAINRSAFSRLKRALIRNGDLHQENNVFSFSRHLAESDIST
jgi:CRP-like cAMP-binding protein